MGSTIFKGSKVATLKDTLQVGKDDATAPTILNLAVDPTSVATSANKGSILINTSNGEIYKKLDAGASTNWEIIGSNGASGINYIKNPDFESGLTDITDDGSGNAVASLETTNFLRGTQSLNMQFKSTASGGEYIEHGMRNVDNQDLGKRVFVKFDYATDTNYVSDDVKVILRNLDSGVDVMVSDDNDGLIQATGSVTSRRKFVGVAEIDSVDNTYAPRFVINSAPATTSNIIIDNISVGPDVPVPGSIVGEWQQYTPTGSWTTNAIYAGRWRRVGDSMQIEAGVDLSGAPNATDFNISLPSGYTIDTNKVSFAAVNESVLGSANIYDSLTRLFVGSVIYNTTTTVGVTHSESGNIGKVNATSPMTFASNDNVNVNFIVPISGWSAGASLSTTENLFSTAKARAFKSASTQTITTATKIVLDVESYDTLNSFSSSSFTVPRSAFYLINGSIRVTAAPASNTRFFTDIYVNGSLRAFSEYFLATGTGSAETAPPVSIVLKLVKGDIVELFGDSNGISTTISNSNETTFLEVIELPDFSTFSIFGDTELIESDSAGLVNYTIAANTIGNLTSIALTAGEWDIYLQAMFFSNGATTTGNGSIGVTNNGATGVGLIDGDNFMSTKVQNSNGDKTSISVMKKGVILTSSDTYYLKASAATSITNLQVAYKMSARRIK